MSAIQSKYEFSLLFDVENGNPNGDPDSGNMPRVDVETETGLITDVCLKRKVRDYVAIAREGVPGYALYISSGRSLNRADMEALKKRGVLPESTPLNDLDKALKELKGKGFTLADGRQVGQDDIPQLVKEAACATYFDVRAFGAVMTSYQKVGAAQIRGPIQMGFARSIDPIVTQEIAITRCVYTTEKEQEEKAGSGTMGRKYIVPYGLYRADGYVSAALAEKYSKLTGAGLSDDDLELFWEALMGMFEFDRSAARGNMASRKLVIFRHAGKMGNAPAHKLFDLVKVEKKPGVTSPRSYDDYEVTVGEAPEGVDIEIRE